MGRPRLPDTERRARVSVNVPPDLLDWAEERSGPADRFQSASHAFTWCAAFVRDQEQRFGSLEEFEIFCREMHKVWIAGRLDEKTFLGLTPSKELLDAVHKADAAEKAAKAERGRPAREKPSRR